jgi:hypothetical protein
MQTRRWVNPSQPQTMQIAVFLLYFRAVSDLIWGIGIQFAVMPLHDLLEIVLPVALGAAGWLIANERKSGWRLGVVAAALPLVARLLLGLGISFGVNLHGRVSPFDYDVLGLLFEVALFVLLVHPQSRDYQRIWFK